MAKLLAGSEHFLVHEIPAYEPSGDGEHLYVEIEKQGLTTEAVAERLAQCTGLPRANIGYAGRKDRHAITRQRFSIRSGSEESLQGLASLNRGGARIEILLVSRHRNKLRRGHLRGNRFRLCLEVSPDEVTTLHEVLRNLQHQGLRNGFGPQRFGFNGASLEIARAWARADFARAVEWVIDPTGVWTLKDELPDGYRHGADGRVLGKLRKGGDPRQALHSAGPAYLKLIASAGQSAIFNAVLAERERAGLLYTLREGDLGRSPRGGVFRCAAEDAESTTRRAQPGELDAFTTGPLPGTAKQRPDPAIDAEERAWSADVAIDWAAFEREGVMRSPGERRPLLVPFLETPEVEVEGERCWLQFALRSGSYATEVLRQAGIDLPLNRAT
ncbi:MAG: tRNA pseudouridine(13) synthase TruD [bacterium]|nr:tRNA pseudouridine(13) synthase TruD [bacterium]